MDDRDRYERAARESFGQLLLKAARLLDERAVERLRALPGAPPVRRAHTRLFPHITFEGIRATHLARRLEVSKQAITPLVADLVAWGLVEQVPDPADGRARLVRWSPGGQEKLLHGLGLLEAFEAELAEQVGAARVRDAREVLAQMVELLGSP